MTVEENTESQEEVEIVIEPKNHYFCSNCITDCEGSCMTEQEQYYCCGGWLLFGIIILLIIGIVYFIKSFGIVLFVALLCVVLFGGLGLLFLGYLIFFLTYCFISIICETQMIIPCLSKEQNKSILNWIIDLPYSVALLFRQFVYYFCCCCVPKKYYQDDTVHVPLV